MTKVLWLTAPLLLVPGVMVATSETAGKESTMFARLWRQIAPPPTRPTRPIVAAALEESTPEEVYYDTAARFLDLQVSTSDALDTRAANTFAVGSTVLPLTFGLLNLGSATVPIIAAWLLGGALVCYVLLLFCVWRTSRLRALEYRPSLPTLEEYSQTYDGRVLRGWVATEYLASTEANRPNLERKARWAGAANSALYFESLLLSVAAILTLL